MKKLIKDMNYLELDEFLNQDIKLSERQLIQVRNHKNVDSIHYWGNGEYTVTILKNGNIYSDVDVFIKEEE